MIQKKVCLLGSFAVGKTSLIQRFVRGIFSEEYLSTVGVKIDKKIVALEEDEVTLVLWDLHGDDEFQRLQDSYLRGTAAYFLVVDQTRANSAEHALALAERAARVAPNAPSVLLLNKSDLDRDWRLTGSVLDRLQTGRPVFETSAKSGVHVEDAFRELAKLSLEEA